VTRYALTIRGPLRGKGRPRARKNGPGVYDDPKNKPAAWRIQAVAHAEGVKPLDGPVKVDITAVGAIPKSWPKRKRAEALALHYDMRKPDADNVTKLVLDALNGVAWGASSTKPASG